MLRIVGRARCPTRGDEKFDGVEFPEIREERLRIEDNCSVAYWRQVIVARR